MLKKIKELAKEKHISIRELEIKCKISNGAIYHWDETKPSYDKVLSVAKELGTTVEELADD